MNSYLSHLTCVYCGTPYPAQPMPEGCPACRSDSFASGLTAVYDYDRLKTDLGDAPLSERGEGLWRYRRLLPVRQQAAEISLGEGGTPLVTLPDLADELGAEQVWIKDESRNPTWTFKDRNAAVTISKAVEFGAGAVVVSTSGNHGVAIAAYAVRAGVECVVLSYPGLPESQQSLIRAFGARLVITEPDKRWEVMEEGIREHGWYPASNYTSIPTNGAYGHEGYKTIAYEIADVLGTTPDVVCVPTSYGEGLYGIWKGFDELERLGRADRGPRMVACEPAGGPLGLAVRTPRQPIVTVPRTPTVARGIGGSVNSYISVAALAASDGLVAQPTDAQIMAAQRRLSAAGFFVEPASAAGLAGLRILAAERRLPPGSRIVLVNTSSGLKNLESMRDQPAALSSGPSTDQEAVSA
ncbi:MULTISPECIES: threonine synthase [unclassified Kribbella]|uniref:threonine synthase n=1 Tax=unclassified Kribbella TaxID=2644121 RepID=UPI003016AD02